MPARPTVLYLGGLGRSGSTLLERMLGELPGFTAGGEIVHLWQRGVVEHELCGCGLAFPQCPFWQQVGLVAFGGWEQLDAGRVASLGRMVDRTRHVPRLAAPVRSAEFQHLVDEYAGHYAALYSAMAHLTAGSVIIDSSKHASLAYCVRRASEVDLKVVHLVRDSRAVAHAWTKPVRRPESADASYMTTYSPAASAGLWNSQNLALQALSSTGASALRIRYEDVVADPPSSLARIVEFAGLDAKIVGQAPWLTERDGTWFAQLHRSHTVSGNPMRFLTGEIALRADDQWKTAMPPLRRRAVTALTLPLLAAYGYGASPR